MPELFVELLSEEIPARMQRRAAEDLQRLVTNFLVDAGLTYEGAYATATPRRLVLAVTGLPARSADRREERKGPRVGAPEKALAGFLRAAGLASIDEATIESDPKKGDFYVAKTVVPGRPTLDIAAEAIVDAVRRFPWPVTMRWGAASSDAGALRWVRPLTSILATFGTENEDPEIVPVEVPGVPVGDTTVGHRFHAPGTIKVRRLEDYKASLEKAFVVVDHERRRDQILHDAKDAVFALGLEMVEDDGLLTEVAGLVEWPVVLVGRFDERVLALPEEVIRLTIRENQKCFVTRDPATGKLANAFILTANLVADDGGAAIVAGNERVVRARLADARFFWDEDMKRRLAVHAEKLKTVTFHEKLGTQADRVERIQALAREIAPVLGIQPDYAVEAAAVVKGDLVTGMVGEFPELQGYMGRHYAAAHGAPEDLATAIEEHYQPQGPNDAVPSARLSVVLALADKVDQLVALWAAGEKPTGSGDAFGLRRAALGIIRLVLENGLRLPLDDGKMGGLLMIAWRLWEGTPLDTEWKAQSAKDYDRFDDDGYGGLRGPVADLSDFVVERLIVQQRDAGVSAETVRAVRPMVTTIDLVDLVNRIAALTDFLATDDGATLMAGYRRATNILVAEEKKDGAPVQGEPVRATLVEPQEIALFDAVAAARKTVTEAVAREDYAAAMTALAALRAPVDAFFEAVMVNADDPGLRANRLRLLAALRDTTREVADFSAISG
ncbi:glycine--tRNA ligase subunit beta [Acuticoccus sp. I52.16.1]|uniref:glycine--tRNA ligase subunit beta n=1 Tax=Acuticoccus sp. I52.16.1 TaxID=2928472 RepID=UPI001FD107FC|nr:glycine--tRNA ligase subunit beta [Acuticoccus sp. I52.16.1]UOM35294.1 glycine--tRNA ligase subunit beta [Acuticoccus sp. I52.16.1]